MKKYSFLLLILFLASGCTGLSDAKKVLKNEKISSTDEFLVKKKEPLVLPPDFDKLPEPESERNVNSDTSEKDKIKKILRADDSNLKEKKNSSSLEESIIEKIR